MKNETIETLKQLTYYMRGEMKMMVPLPEDEEYRQVLSEYEKESLRLKELLKELSQEQQAGIERYLECMTEKMMIEEERSYRQGFVDIIRLMDSMNIIQRTEEEINMEMREFLDQLLDDSDIVC